ncbi:PEF-CTERM sorting domain-containing protein [Methanolobus psychrotolerans]|uniref:PEF-CTERM sorting domain-containing protein n=1 Tax=Methanolobus psychrotolerans TaxID=1874706 RepID=UPI000B91BE10|nr:PEF-CTERM sorting domain-containing protein [Methanolobus psychrotolerans]
MKLNEILLIALALAIFFVSTAAAGEILNPGEINETFIVHDGETLWIHPGDSLSIAANFVIESGGIFINEGDSLRVSVSQFTVKQNGTFVNRGDWFRTQMSEFNFENNSIIINEGTLYFGDTSINNFAYINNSGSFGVSDFAILNNYGTVYNTGTLGFIGSVYNHGLIETFGQMNILPLYHFENMETGIINNNGLISLAKRITNNGIINNYGDFMGFETVYNNGAIICYPGSTFGGDTELRIIVEGNPVQWANQENNIPEFPTIALPMIAIIGLALFFKRRK